MPLDQLAEILNNIADRDALTSTCSNALKEHQQCYLLNTILLRDFMYMHT